MATDAAAGRRSLRAGLTARTRIMAWVLALTTVGLVGAGAAVYVVEDARIEQRADRNILQEIDELERLGQGLNPQTGQEFVTARELMETALRQSISEEYQVLVALVDGRARYVSAGPGSDLARDPTFLSAVQGLPDGGFSIVDTPLGEVRLGVRAVRQGGVRGSYVVAYFTDPLRGEFKDVVRSYVVAALLTLLAIGVGGWFVAGRLLGPLHTLRTTAQTITEADLDERIETSGTDDISELARTFNSMLDRLQAAFATQRQFLDDAGHELATPITILRGHLELVDENDPTDVADTRDLLLDELDRMGRLVGDLVLLAKAERPDFLRTTEVDVGDLTDRVLELARGLGDRAWRLDARAAGAVLLGDPHRLTQALMQLAANAVRYTEPGTTVAIGSAADGSSVRLWVRDEGPGVEEADAQRIFDRFTRGSRGSSEDGSGLGLSIVCAIVAAHDGHVTLDSTPGHGATFTITVPARRPLHAS